VFGTRVSVDLGDGRRPLVGVVEIGVAVAKASGIPEAAVDFSISGFDGAGLLQLASNSRTTSAIPRDDIWLMAAHACSE
jgi:hypothetical protein